MERHKNKKRTTKIFTSFLRMLFHSITSDFKDLFYIDIIKPILLFQSDLFFYHYRLNEILLLFLYHYFPISG
jgi:hypothetical protein